MQLKIIEFRLVPFVYLHILARQPLHQLIAHIEFGLVLLAVDCAFLRLHSHLLFLVLLPERLEFLLKLHLLLSNQLIFHELLQTFGHYVVAHCDKFSKCSTK